MLDDGLLGACSDDTFGNHQGYHVVPDAVPHTCNGMTYSMSIEPDANRCDRPGQVDDYCISTMHDSCTILLSLTFSGFFISMLI